MDPTPDPKQPKPRINSLATKGTTDAQSADKDTTTNLPGPDSAASSADLTADESESESQQATDVLADPTAASTRPELPGESDPGASNTSNDEPL